MSSLGPSSSVAAGKSNLAIADPSVSRRHAKIAVGGDGCVIEDLGSANGTFVNHRRIAAPTPLHDGDQVAVGFVLTTFTGSGKGAAKKSPAAPGLRYEEPTQAPTVLLKISTDVGKAAETDDELAALTLPNLLRFLDDFSKISNLVFDEPALVSFVVDSSSS